MNTRFLIVVTGWNWELYIQRALQSIMDQTYTNYIVSVVDDGSVDDSVMQIAKFTKFNGLDWCRISTPLNRGTFYARKAGIDAQSDYDAIVLLDGDDCLLPNALEECAKHYEAGKLMTYGNWLNQAGVVCGMNLKYSDQVHADRSYRKDTFRCTHLRTFHRSLYEAVIEWELTQAEINSYPDAELLFSMMELAGRDRIGIVYEPIYIYNETNENGTLKRFGKDDLGYEEITNRQRRELCT